MTSEPDYHPSGPLALALVLAGTAGFVDAFIFRHVTPVFVANMSGNMIHLGMSGGDGDWRAAAATAVTVTAFVFGVVAATVHHDRTLDRAMVVRPDRLLAFEAVLLLALPLALVVLDIGFAAPATFRQYPVLLIGGFAMGVQTTALRRVGQVAVSTTYGTGALARIGEKVALGVRGAERSDAVRRRMTIWVLASILVCYVLGAAVASAAGPHRWLLLIPGLVIAGAAAALHR